MVENMIHFFKKCYIEKNSVEKKLEKQKLICYNGFVENKEKSQKLENKGFD